MAKREGEATELETQNRNNEEQNEGSKTCLYKIDGRLPNLLELYKFGNRVGSCKTK